MQEEEQVVVGGIPTHLVSCGSAVRGMPLVLVVPGNPGTALFYRQFVAALSARLRGTLVVAVGHAGHFVHEHDGANASLFGLDAQVAHKRAVLALLRARAPQCRVVLVAHSIGAWMALEMLRLGEQVDASVLLMPTLRHLHRGMTPVVRVAIHPVATWVLATLVHWLPLTLREWLLWALTDTDEVRLVVMDHCSFDVVANILSMAREEAHRVVEPLEDHLEVLRRHRERQLLVFSQCDHYVPLHYVDELRRQVPGVQVHVCQPHVEHAFVLRQPEEVAAIVAEQMTDKWFAN